MPHDPLSAGKATVLDETRDAFSLPIPELSEAHRRRFFVGNSLFNQNWVGAPASVESRDGLGPLFNARSCSGCHFKDGRGHPPETGQPLSSLLLRISMAQQKGPRGEPLGDPIYGDQIQGSARPGGPPEAEVYIDYAPLYGAFADGERFELLSPSYRLEHLGYGALAKSTLLSARVPPSMVGLGLLEEIPEAELLALADPGDSDHDGISGRINRVLELGRDTPAIGRFGWKAEQPSVLQQTAAAFLGDMGLTSRLLREENHNPSQLAAAGLPSGGEPEVADELLDAVALYARTLAVPARRNHNDPRVAHGEDLFASIGCAACHVPSLRINASVDIPELGHGTIHPYTDLLLHDLGPELSDERPAFVAEGSEWRTPPLWGIGLVEKVNGHTRFLHDGRARDFKEAILWHGGEAQIAKLRFTELNQPERQDLLAFLRSL
jgi:CxxC motif-containing protein (DUF1111 family)